MSQTLSLNNFGDANIIQQTRLDADSPGGSTTFTVQNSTSFVAGTFFLLGTPGSETAEILIVQSAPTSTTITTTTSSELAHDRYDFATALFGNELNIYRAADTNGIQPPDSSFAVLATVTIQPDQATTSYTDNNGSSAYWYKYTYLNGTTSSESNIADSKAGRGGGSGDYCTIEQIRTEAGFRYAKYITDDMIDDKRKAAQDEINGTLAGFYELPFATPLNPFIVDICVRLAAGLLLLEQLGGQISSTSNGNGQSKVDGARDDLAKLTLKEVVLTDTNGQSFALPGATGGASSWPDDSTDATGGTRNISNGVIIGEGQDAGHVFQMRDLLGYTHRRY